MNNNKDLNKLYENYVEDLRSYLNWSLSNLNKYKNELIDIGFVIYLELYSKLFKLSKSYGKNYIMEFKNVFNKKFENYIQKLLQYKFLDQLDELFLINIGYNKSNKYIIVITK
ncbi:uncharacterized protein TA07725 [Theileria annulata]|uniref:Uncharacterized protein n=1 Tax=Theileria annulata TaxID=5874 RepID=Q4UAK7_THEAN|nr:uncharacterized protein TA07725 [Theileria annulata]CAI76144.1 hypothetical protein TA07725 [Theileria annulata]|eukprot:XP_952770.1 hypothetical protein TA07725 [Theileria annulata]